MYGLLSLFNLQVNWVNYKNKQDIKKYKKHNRLFRKINVVNKKQHRLFGKSMLSVKINISSLENQCC